VRTDSRVLRPKAAVDGPAQASGAKFFSTCDVAAIRVVARKKMQAKEISCTRVRRATERRNMLKTRNSSAFLYGRDFFARGCGAVIVFRRAFFQLVVRARGRVRGAALTHKIK
jgi:hypothetical protein